MTRSEFDLFFDDLIKPTFVKKEAYNVYKPVKMAFDVKDDKLELAFSVIGHDPKTVEVTLTEDRINVKAKKNKECNSVLGQFVVDIDETAILSKEYDGTTAQAEIRNGILLISIDKKEAQKPKRLSIKF